MLDKLKNKKKGDPFPGAAHVNALNEAARRVLQSPNYSARDYPPWQQRLMRIVSIDYPLGQALYLKRVYEIRPMFYNENDDERELSSDSSNEVDIADDWEVDDESDAQFLDASQSGRDFGLDQVVAAYFDAQRGMWIPLVPPADACCCNDIADLNVLTEFGYPTGSVANGYIWPGVLTFDLPELRTAPFYLYRAADSNGVPAISNYDYMVYYSNVFELLWQDFDTGTQYTVNAWWILNSDPSVLVGGVLTLCGERDFGAANPAGVPRPLAVYISDDSMVPGVSAAGTTIVGGSFDPLTAQRYQIHARRLLPPNFKGVLPKYICVKKTGPVDVVSTALTELFGSSPPTIFVDVDNGVSITTHTLNQVTTGASKLDCYAISSFISGTGPGFVRAKIDDSTLAIVNNKIRFEIGTKSSRTVAFESDFSRPFDVTITGGSGITYRFYE